MVEKGPRSNIPQERHILYFSLFHGAQVVRSALVKESPMMEKTVDVLINSGLVHAQQIFTEEGGIDTILSIPRSERAFDDTNRA